MPRLVLASSISALAALSLSVSAYSGPLSMAQGSTPSPPVAPMTTQGLLDIVEIGPSYSSSLSISPDGRRYAIMAHQAKPADNSYETAWFVGDIAADRPAVNVGDGGDASLYRNAQGGWNNRPAEWSSDSRTIYYLKKTDDGVQIWASAADGGAARAATHSAADVTSFALSSDGRTIFYLTDAPRAEIAAAQAAEYRAGYHADDKAFFLLYMPRPYHPPYYLQGGKPTYWALDLASGATRAASAEDMAAALATPLSRSHLAGTERASGVHPGAGEFKLSWLDVVDPDVNRGLVPPRRVTASRSSDGAMPISCPDPACRGDFLQNLGFSSRGEVIFLRSDTGVRRLYVWRPGASKAHLAKTIEGDLSGCKLNRDEVICTLETPIWPRRLVGVNLASGALRTIAEPNPDFGHWKLGQVKRLDWKSAHGVPTWGNLVYPVDYQPGRRYPLVFVQYSPEDCLRGGVGDEFPTHVFSAHGMMVLCTGGAGMPRTLYEREPDNRKVYVAEFKGYAGEIETLSSFEIIVRQLDQEGLIDPKRVGITGLSHGAETVMYALVHSKAFLVAGMAQIGLDEFSYFGAVPPSIDIMLNPIGWGDPYKPSENWGYKDFSLSTNVDRIDTPLIVQTSDREYLNAVPTFRRWRDAGKSMDLYVFDDEYHVKWQPAHRLAVYNRYVDWFDFWLNDRENDRAAKPDQYALWEGFRAKECAMPNAADKAYCAAIK